MKSTTDFHTLDPESYSYKKYSHKVPEVPKDTINFDSDQTIIQKCVMSFEDANTCNLILIGIVMKLVVYKCTISATLFSVSLN